MPATLEVTQSPSSAGVAWTADRPQHTIDPVLTRLGYLLSVSEAVQVHWRTVMPRVAELIMWATARGAHLPRLDARPDGGLRIEWREPQGGVIVDVLPTGKRNLLLDGQETDITVDWRRFQFAVRVMVSSRQETWIELLESEGPEHSSRKALRGVIFLIDGLLEREELNALNALLASVDLQRLSLSAILTIVQSVMRARRHLPGWGAFRRSVEVEIRRRGENSAELLYGVPAA